jgi:biotin operon repressor
MGQRSRTETVAAVMAAFFARRSWSQAELAREVGVRTEALRKLLQELQASGVHLESEKEHPHVYWSVPKTWFPGGVLFKEDDVAELLRQLRRLPRSKARDRLLAVIVDQLPPRERPSSAVAVVSRPTSEQEEQSPRALCHLQSGSMSWGETRALHVAFIGLSARVAIRSVSRRHRGSSPCASSWNSLRVARSRLGTPRTSDLACSYR